MQFFTTYILPYLNFAIFLVVLIKFAKKPTSDFLANRKQKFKFDYEEARKLLTEAESQSDAINKRMAGLDKELQEISQKAAAVAQQEVQRVQVDAERLANHFRGEVSRLADAEVNQALVDLKKELMSGVMKQVQQKLSDELDQDTQNKIIELSSKKILKIDDSSTAEGANSGSGHVFSSGEKFSGPTSGARE